MPTAFLDLTRQHRELEAEIASAVARVLSGGVYILGAEVEAFEGEWARFCGVKGAAAVGNGTDALALALMASSAVRAGCSDEVITSPLTAAYTALAILNAGGVPVFADVDTRTLTLDPEAVERAITPRTRAIVPVHLYGQMADVGSIEEIAARHDLILIEDGAQAHGACFQGRTVGAHGQAAAFSFYPTKNLGAYGDGGAVTSNDVALIERVKVLRQGGHASALRANLVGRNSRLDEIQAAMLRVKLGRLNEWNVRRRRLAATYDEVLGRGARCVMIPSVHSPEAHVHHLYVIQHPERDHLRSHLAACGIETMIHYPYLLHHQPLFRQASWRALPNAERAAERILSLPLYPQLEMEEQAAVINAVLAFP